MRDEALEFPDLLRLIDERSGAFRAAVSSAPSLDVQVPTCPDWRLFDFARHIGEGRRTWAATVSDGPGAIGKATADGAPPAPRVRAGLDTWLAESTQELLEALQDSGPDRACWTWWGTSQSPQTCTAVARHQLQEVADHTYDALLAMGDRQPIPPTVALDAVEDFQFTCCATTSGWPHDPAVIDYHATEGRSWRLWLSSSGARAARLCPATAGEEPGPAYASAKGTASDLVLNFWGRHPLDPVELAGDRRVFDRLVAWDPE